MDCQCKHCSVKIEQLEKLVEALSSLAHCCAADEVETLLFANERADLAVSLRLDRQLRSAQS